MNDLHLPYHRAPRELRARVEAAVRQAAAPRSRWRVPVVRLAASAALLVLVAVGSWRAGARQAQAVTEASGLLSSHLRQLASGSLVAVASSDQHTVKPWFAGKLDFSPPVVDGAAAGYPLAGGRVDFVLGRPAAVLVYLRRAHAIEVFVQPLEAGAPAPERTIELRGYQVLAWTRAGMRFWAVSDVNVGELAQLRDLLVRP